jgi:hypothetical protein
MKTEWKKTGRRIAMVACGIFVLSMGKVQAADAGYVEQLGSMLENYQAESKVMEVDLSEDSVCVNGEITTLEKELGVSTEEADEALISKDDLASLVTQYGYEQVSKTENSVTYENKFELRRLIVRGNVSDETAVKSAKSNGYTILQYETPEEAAVAYDSFRAKYEVIMDDYVEVETEAVDYSSTMMHTSAMKENLSQDHAVTVAVIDSGVDTDAIGAKCVTGVNAVDKSDDVTDTYGHGTAVASIIDKNTGSGISILPIKTMDANNNATITAISYAIWYAADHADIINMSMGCVSESAASLRFWNDGIDRAIKNNVPFIVSAGNEAASTDNIYPACYEPCWTVGAIDANQEIADFSNYGNIDFVAPGVNMYLTGVGGSSRIGSGTSFSAPILAAFTANLMSDHTYSSVDELYQEVVGYCEDLGAEGYDKYYGYGVPVYHVWTSDEDGSVCSVCDKVKETAHRWEVDSKAEPTCTKKGKIVYQCSLCGFTKTETIAKISHTLVTDKAVAATCKSTGKTEGSHCSVCGYVNKAQTTIPKKDHVYTTVVVPATSSEDGYKKTLCQNCGEVVATVTIARSYTINPTVPKSVKAVSGKKSLTVKWKKISKQISGYQIRYSTSKKFKNAKTVTIKNTKVSSKTIKKLSAKKKYYVQVRSFETVGGKNYYSDWSKTVVKNTK